MDLLSTRHLLVVLSVLLLVAGVPKLVLFERRSQRRSRNTLSEEFVTNENIFNFQVRRVW